MRNSIRLAMVVLLAASPAFARPSSPGLTPTERCDAWIDNLHLDLNHGGQVSATALADGGCRYDRVGLGFDTRFNYEIAVLDVRGIDFDPAAESGPPMIIRVDARGIEETRSGLSGAQQWMFKQMMTPFDVVLDLKFDPEAKVATLRELSLTGPAVGRVELDTVIEGTDEIDDYASTRFGLRTLHERIDSSTFLTRFILPVAVDFLAQPDPANDVARAKLETTIFLTDALPHAGASKATIAAILGMIADLPRIQHPFEIKLTTPGEPITPRDFDNAVRSSEGVADLMAKLRVEATYDGPFTKLSPP